MFDETDELAAMFDPAVFGELAKYRAGGVGAGTDVAILLDRPDALLSFGRTQRVVATHQLQVRVAEVPALAAGDTFTLEVGGEVLRVQGKPERDEARRIWSAEAVP